MATKSEQITISCFDKKKSKAIPIAPNTVFNLLASYNLTPNKKKKTCYTGYVMILYS